MSQRRADEVVLPLLLEYGINHIDTAADYGESELRLAPWLAEHRGDFFLATKTGHRSGERARAGLERSLERMGVDYVDLIQLHNLVEEDQWCAAHRPGGAVEALIQARDEGLVHHIGVTGHGLRIAGMHLRSLAEFDYDSVLLPYSWLLLENPGYRHDVEQLLALCADRDVAVQTIKAVARRRWAGRSEAKFSWYEPLTDEGAIARAVRYVLANEQLFLNTSSDARILSAILAGGASPVIAPEPSELADDAVAHNMSALFDGNELEVI